MSQAAAVGLGAIAGATVFLGLPVARIRGLPKYVQGFLNAFATGILVFLLWDILSHAGGPVTAALEQGQRGSFTAMALIFAGGIAAGLLGLVYFNRSLFSHLRHGTATPNPRSLSLAIATGLGLHNLSEGLAIGESFGEVVQSQPGGDGQRKRARVWGCGSMSQVAEQAAIEVNEAQQARCDPSGKDESHGGKRSALALFERGGHRSARVAQDVPEQEYKNSGCERVQKALDILRQTPDPRHG